MTPEDFGFRSRVSRFISGSSSRSRFGFSATPRFTRLSNIIPRRAVPQQVLETLQRKTTSDFDDGIETNQRGINSLGKITLDLEQTKNNLEKIIEIIASDYKNTQEINKKEIDDYRKRIANRGRIFGKRELGDKKSDVLGVVKKYVGSFFSGAGGAIRALAMFNLLQGILSGDPSKIIGPLLGIGMTYIPSIIGGVIGSVIGGVGKGLLGRLFGGGARAAAPAAAGAAGASRLGGLGKLGGRAALVGGGLALASSLFNKPQDQSQQRLEQLTEQQKGLTSPSNLVPLPQDDLKRFEKLNKKFEEALDFLMKKQRESQNQPGRGGSGGGGGGPSPTPTPTPGDTPQDVVSTGQTIPIQGGITYYGPGFEGNPTANQETFDPNQLTAAHRTLPFGTLLKVTNNDNGKSVVVRVNDRGPFLKNRSLDLSTEAMRRLGGIDAGVLRNATIEVVRAAPSSSGPPTYPSISPPITTETLTVPPTSRGISPLPQGNNVSILPFPVDATSQSPSSASSAGNDSVPVISTTYGDNFLTLYSRLTYQIV